MNKAELLERCEELGIEADESMTNAVLQDLIDETIENGIEAGHLDEDGNPIESDEDESDEDESDEDESDEDESDEDESDEDESELKEDVEEVEIRIKRKHPKNAFRVGSIIVEGRTFKKYLLTQDEIAELDSEGCQAWLEVK